MWSFIANELTVANCLEYELRNLIYVINDKAQVR